MMVVVATPECTNVAVVVVFETTWSVEDGWEVPIPTLPAFVTFTNTVPVLLATSNKSLVCPEAPFSVSGILETPGEVIVQFAVELMVL